MFIFFQSVNFLKLEKTDEILIFLKSLIASEYKNIRRHHESVIFWIKFMAKASNFKTYSYLNVNSDDST